MIGFYLMTEKGFEVLRSVLQAYGAQAVSFVVAAKDAQLQKDYYTEIEMICREHSIPFFNREEIAGLLGFTSSSFTRKWCTTSIIAAKSL